METPRERHYPEQKVSDSGLPGFLSKTRPIATKKYSPKVAQLLFRGDPLVKNSITGGKIHIFWRGSPGKSRIPGAKYHIIVVASTRWHEKHPAERVLK